MEVLFKHKIDTNTKNEYDVASVKSNALAVVNYDADIPEYDGDSNDSLKYQYSFEELENMLGIKILQSEYYKKDFINQGYTEKNNGKLARATFYMNDITSESNSKDGKIICDMTISFMTKYNKEKEMQFVTGFGQGGAKREFFIEKLKTTAFVVQFWPEENAYVKYCYIYFNYENISYQFKMFIHGGNFEEQVKDFLNSFEYK